MKEYIAAAMRVVRWAEGGEALVEGEPRRGEVSSGGCDDAGVILCTPRKHALSEEMEEMLQSQPDSYRSPGESIVVLLLRLVF